MGTASSAVRRARFAGTSNELRRDARPQLRAAVVPDQNNYSVSTVDWPEMSKRLRQRMFLQAIMSSLRTM